MILIETIAYISAIIILGLFSSIIAYFLKLAKEVDEKIELVERKLVERRTEKIKAEFEKMAKSAGSTESPPKTPYDVLDSLQKFWYDSAMIDFSLKHEMLEKVYVIYWDLTSFKDAIFTAIILFSITIAISITDYSSYSILTFLGGFLVLFYASYKLMRVLSGLRR